MSRIITMVLLLGGSLGPALADQIIYDDALVNGWQDYGWATLNYANTSPVHSGTYSISVTAGAYEALYLHHAPFATSCICITHHSRRAVTAI